MLYTGVSQEHVDLIGDSRSDSPRYNAKYGTYMLMNSATNEIVDTQLWPCLCLRIGSHHPTG